MPAPGAPRVLAHRGASGHAPENSLEAFRLARSLGADGIELDVHHTADGVLLVHHDPVLPGLGPIQRLSHRETAGFRLTNGEPIPTLAQALGSAPDLSFWIEVKALDPAQDRVLFDVIDAAPRPHACAVHSFDHPLIERLYQARPELRLGILATARLPNPVRSLAEAGAVALWQEWQVIDAALATEVHAAGAELIAWTVNDATVARGLAAFGVDVLCGNFPERLRLD